MSKRQLITSLIIITALLLTSCSSLPVPEELMRPPAGDETINLDFNPKVFVPTGMELLTPSNSGGRFRIIDVDMDYDGTTELVLFFGNPEELVCKGFAILNDIKDWYKSYEELYDDNDRYNVESVEFENITGAGSKEMVVELSTYNSARIFTIRMFTPEPVRMCMFGADRVDIIKREEGNPLLAIWNYNDGGFDIDAIKWDRDGFVTASYDAPGYFANLIPSYEKAAKNEENGLLYLADVFLKAGDYSRCLQTVNEFLKEERGNELKLKAEIIMARCLYNLGEAEEAGAVLFSAEIVQGYDPDLLIEAFLLITDIHITKGSLNPAREMIQNTEKMLYFYIRSDYRYHLWSTEIEKRRRRLDALEAP